MRVRVIPEHELFDPALLDAGCVPTDLVLSRRRVIFLWQPPSLRTLVYLRQTFPDVPIIVGRFEAETPVYDSKVGHDPPYWCAADFFPLRTLVEMEIASADALRDWRGPPPTAYLGMPLVDGDIPRIRCWSNLLASAAVLLLLRRQDPNLEVITDWYGAKLAAAAGLRIRHLWQASIRDANWPIRRQLREFWTGLRGGEIRARSAQERAHSADIVILAAGWVDDRLLRSFPIEALVEAGARCSLWVHRRSPALEDLVARCDIPCEHLEYPPPATGVQPIQHQVHRWCIEAAHAGAYAPLRGVLAEAAVKLVDWPRWAPKLVAMHRVLTERLQQAGARLVIAPAEKDWAPYCGHYAARHLGIPSVGIKHSTWPPGSRLERFNDAHYFPTAATHILGFTPMDAERHQASADPRKRCVLWRGNTRLMDEDISEMPQRHLRILIAPRGSGPGRSISLRRALMRTNLALMETLCRQFGPNVGIRLHPWDAADHYSDLIRSRILPPDQPLAKQLQEHAAVVTTYSTVALDAAAAGRPVFLWDHAEMRMAASEVALEGGAVVAAELERLCAELDRFLHDAVFRDRLRERAGNFPRYLCGDASGDVSRNLAGWLMTLAHIEHEPPGLKMSGVAGRHALQPVGQK